MKLSYTDIQVTLKKKWVQHIVNIIWVHFGILIKIYFAR